MSQIKTGAEIRQEAMQRDKDIKGIAEAMKAKQWAIEKVVQLGNSDPKVIKELTEFFYGFLTNGE